MSEWQGHLLSCPGQLNIMITDDVVDIGNDHPILSGSDYTIGLTTAFLFWEDTLNIRWLSENIFSWYCFVSLQGGAKQAGIGNLFIRSWMWRWWWPKNKLHIIRCFYDEYKNPIKSLIWKEKSSFIITWQLKICELSGFDKISSPPYFERSKISSLSL